ncbi:hypothetical protein [Dickeya chrysanthemi]|uniref:hypothetical protein n=1 Tax=Dickeya chrysanthemi TaxID=556 RepID=UPI000532A51B|nr:hypothetical protein [Dickeya chrysanthemi]
MTIIFIPALITLLTIQEEKAGKPLTKEDVENIRDNATAISVPEDIAIIMTTERGYNDISAENVWDEWISFKASGVNS